MGGRVSVAIFRPPHLGWGKPPLASRFQIRALKRLHEVRLVTMILGGPPTKRPRDDTAQGFWLLYNQASDLAWPTPNDGPFDGDWRRSQGAPYMYSKVYDQGATLGRASGVPFALVGSTVHQDRSTNPVLYRFSGEAQTQSCADSAEKGASTQSLLTSRRRKGPS